MDATLITEIMGSHLLCLNGFQLNLGFAWNSEDVLDHIYAEIDKWFMHYCNAKFIWWLPSCVTFGLALAFLLDQCVF